MHKTRTRNVTLSKGIGPYRVHSTVCVDLINSHRKGKVSLSCRRKAWSVRLASKSIERATDKKTSIVAKFQA